MLKKLLLVLFIATVAGAAVYLAPGSKELALMEMEDDNYSESLQHYTALYEQGDRSINVVGPLIRLQVHYGQVDKAIALLETMARDNPHSAESRLEMAKLYLTSQRFYAYCENLEELQKIEPSAKILRELADTYDFMGEHAMAGEALARLVTAPDYTPHEADYYRLASFYHLRGEREKALASVEAFLDNPDNEFSMDMIELGLYILLENGEEAKALQVASAYLERHKEEEYAIVFSQRFEEYEMHASALKVLDPFRENINARSPYLMQQVVTILERLGRDDEAYAMLTDRFAQGNFPDSLATWLIDLAVERSQYDFIERLLKETTPSYLQEDVLLRYAAMATQIGRPGIAVILQEKLGESYLREAPLIAAILKVGATPSPSAMKMLLAQEGTLVTPEQKLVVADVYALRGYPKDAYRLIQDMSFPYLLDALNPGHLAEMYLAAGKGGEGIRKLREAESDASPELRAKIEEAELMLAVGQGDGEALARVMAKAKSKPELLKEAYYIAERHGQDKAMFVLAEHLYRLEPTQQHRIQLAQAQLLQGGYDASLALFTAAVEQVPQSPGMIRLKAQVPEGKMFFLALADPLIPLSPKAGELVSYWREHLTPHALRWMESKARSAPKEEKLHWLAHMNNIHHPESVLASLKGVSSTSGDIQDEYLRALSATRSTDTLARELKREIAKETEEGRLMRLTKLARESDLPTLASEGFRRIYAINPRNLVALREMALLEAYSGRYTKAADLIESYLERKPGDYRVYSAYAEILQRRKQKDEARRYFELAYATLSRMKEKDLSAHMEEARLLFRINQQDKGTKLYQALLRRYPENTDVRAEYAEMLIGAKKFDEASLVLAP